MVKGTGFDPAGNVGGRGVPIPADLPQGTYVVFGKFLDDWKPSEGATTSARPVGSQKWALAADVLDQVPAQYQGAIRAQWVNINEAGEFTAELVVAEGDKFTYEGNFGVYTYPAGGSGNPAQEQYAPINVKEDVTPEPTETPTQPTTPEPTQSASPEPTAPATPQPSEPATPQPTQPSGNGDKPGALPSTGGEDAGVFAAGAVLLISGALIAARAGARKKV